MIPDITLTKVRALNDSNVWAVGTGAILHTTDGGVTWTNLAPAGSESTALQGLSVLDANDVWVTGVAKDGYATLLKSSDAGASWTRQSGGDVTNADHLIGLSAVDSQTAWAGGGTGSRYIALRTTDGGTTWNWQAEVNGAWDANEVCAVSTSVVWTACDFSLHRSSDGGANWAAHGVGGYTVGLSAVNDLEAWATRYSYNGTIFHTTDGGTNWTQTSQLDGQALPGLSTVSFAPQMIPEPSTLMLGLCCLGLGVLWLRRRRNC